MRAAGKIFLGKPGHWLLCVLVVLAMYGMGEMRLHVREFWAFVLIVPAVVTAVLLWIVLRHRPGDVVTRDPITVIPAGKVTQGEEG